MASQNCSGKNPFVEVSLCIRGVYNRSWKLKAGDILQLQREPDNGKDNFAVAVCKQLMTTYLVVSLACSQHFCKETCGFVHV